MKNNKKNIIDTEDEDTVKILTALQKNSKNSYDLIAHRCGFSRQKVWRVIKQLEENNIMWGYTVVSDEQKQGLQKFVLLIKRSLQKLEEKTADIIASNKLEADYLKMGITIESSYYLHGEYDWVLIFTTKNLKYAKKFSNLLMEMYPGVILKVNLMQVLYTKRTHHIFNPETQKLKDFL
jgi:Lrp/AsnC family leucine-responsive transcriptional regulator